MKNSIAALFVFICFSLSAQNSVTEGKHRSGRFILKWSPLHLINHYPTFQVAIEHRIGKNISLQYDFGPVINVDGSTLLDAFDKKGFKSKFEIRRYILPRAKHWQFYYAPEIYFNRVNYKKSEAYQVNCIDGNCEYTQYVTSDMHYRESGINLKTGALFHVYRFCIDFQVGMAARFISYTPMNLPLDPKYIKEDRSDDNLGFGTIEKSRNVLSPTFCIRFGYIIQYTK